MVAARRRAARAAVTRRLIEQFVRRARAAAPTPPVLPTLTEREREVLVAVADGLSNGEIAAGCTSLSTVKTHVSHLLTKLDARDRAQLVMIAHRAGLPYRSGLRRWCTWRAG